MSLPSILKCSTQWTALQNGTSVPSEVTEIFNDTLTSQWQTVTFLSLFHNFESTQQSSSIDKCMETSVVVNSVSQS